MQSSLTDSYKQVVKRCFSHKSEARCRRSSGSAAQFHHVITMRVHVVSGSLYAKHIHPSFCFQCSLLNSRPGRYTLTQVGKSLCVCVCVCVAVFPGSSVDGRSTAWRWRSGTVLVAAEAWLCPSTPTSCTPSASWGGGRPSRRLQTA